MYELSGNIQGLSRDMTTGKATLSLAINEIGNAKGLFDKYRDCEIDIKISKHRKHRSNDANKYCWVLCGKLAEELSKDNVPYTSIDIYRKAIQDVGVYIDKELDKDTAGTFQTAWSLLGLGWLTEQIDYSRDGNSLLIRFYYGSSTYNTKQMSRLIDYLVTECKEYDIPTETPEEIARIKSLWERVPLDTKKKG